MQASSFIQSTPITNTLAVLDSQSLSLDEFGEPFERTQLPWFKDPTKKISIWTIIKDSIGKDVAKMSVPVYCNDPLSIV
jgi:oxysterol-binding protein 1